MKIISDTCPYCGSLRMKGDYEYRPYLCRSFSDSIFRDRRVTQSESCKDRQLQIAEKLIREAVLNIDFTQPGDRTLCGCGGLMGFPQTHKPFCLRLRIENFLIAREGPRSIAQKPAGDSGMLHVYELVKELNRGSDENESLTEGPIFAYKFLLETDGLFSRLFCGPVILVDGQEFEKATREELLREAVKEIGKNISALVKAKAVLQEVLEEQFATSASD